MKNLFFIRANRFMVVLLNFCSPEQAILAPFKSNAKALPVSFMNSIFLQSHCVKAF